MNRWYRTPVLREVGHACVYFPLRAVYGLVALLPAALLRPACLAVAALVHCFDRPHTRIARRNLALVFPELHAAERRALVRRVYRHFALMMRDTILLWQARRKDVLERFFETPDLTTLRALKAEGKGLVLVTGHLGNWELAGCALTGVYQINGISRRFRNPLIRRSILRLRRSFGQNVIFAREGLDAMLACLRRNECLALLPDKRLRAARITVAFFGRRVRVPSTPALLSWRTGAPLLTGGALRIGETPRFRLVHGEPIRPDPTAPKGREIRRLSQAWTTALEQLIRQHPEQWIWTHNRFKQSAPAERVQPESVSTPCLVLR
ncbi:MAG: hypothetical protein JXQ29_09050 [Planctomycetes bacterium]|nr:hypothetical protein [Planctomycetota bacterium]